MSRRATPSSPARFLLESPRAAALARDARGPPEIVGDIAARRGSSGDELLRRNPRLRGKRGPTSGVGDVFHSASAREDTTAEARDAAAPDGRFRGHAERRLRADAEPDDAGRSRGSACASSSGGGHRARAVRRWRSTYGGGGSVLLRGASLSRRAPGSVDVADAAGARYDTRRPPPPEGHASFSDEVNHSSNASSGFRRTVRLRVCPRWFYLEYLRDVGERARLAAERASGARRRHAGGPGRDGRVDRRARTKRLGMEAAKAASATIPKVIEGLASGGEGRRRGECRGG